MAVSKRRGARTVLFEEAPVLCSAAAIVGDMEGEGPLGKQFDKVLTDDTWGEDSFEKAERKMYEEAVRLALAKACLAPDALGCMLGGDLLNQLISANYAARQLDVPFLGLYSACSTISEALLVGGMLIDGGFLDTALCAVSSHFSTAERQFRYPLEMGTVSPPTAQRTITGAGAILLASMGAARTLAGVFPDVRLTGGTIGKVVDLGIKDMANMGAAMAPAAAQTIMAHLKDMGCGASDFDAIITGDLGAFGSEMLLELCAQEGLYLKSRHQDCGALIFSKEQKLDCGGSGAGCSTVVLASHILPMLQAGDYTRVLFLATGALMSPSSNMQGDTIPGIAHALVLERQA